MQDPSRTSQPAPSWRIRSPEIRGLRHHRSGFKRHGKILRHQMPLFRQYPKNGGVGGNSALKMHGGGQGRCRRAARRNIDENLTWSKKTRHARSRASLKFGVPVVAVNRFPRTPTGLSWCKLALAHRVADAICRIRFSQGALALSRWRKRS